MLITFGNVVYDQSFRVDLVLVRDDEVWHTLYNVFVILLILKQNLHLLIQRALH